MNAISNLLIAQKVVNSEFQKESLSLPDGNLSRFTAVFLFTTGCSSSDGEFSRTAFLPLNRQIFQWAKNYCNRIVLRKKISRKLEGD